MTPRSQRTLLRVLHLVLGACVGAVIYLPPTWVELLRLALGIVVVPALALTGLLMWQQARVRRLFGPSHRVASEDG